MKLPPDVKKFFQETGKRGGKATAKNMTKEQRAEAARKAVAARWAKTTPEERKAFAQKIRRGKSKRGKAK